MLERLGGIEHAVLHVTARALAPQRRDVRGHGLRVGLLGAGGHHRQLLAALQVLDRIHAACDPLGLAVGYPAIDVAMAKPLLDRGAKLIATGDTMQLGRAMSSFVAEVGASVE